jgi:phosphate transport system permease protein
LKILVKKLIQQKLAESFIYLAGIFTTIVILFIVYFLFTEGRGLFSSNPIEDGYSIVVNKYNKVTTLKSSQIKKVFEGDTKNWNEIGGFNDSIKIFTLSEVEYVFNQSDLGENYEFLNQKIAAYINANTGVIAYFPEKYLDKSLDKIKVLPIGIGEMLTGKEWYPTSTPTPLFGTLPIILGSLLVSILAILIALPLGLSVAVFLSEIAPEPVANVYKTFIELMSGIPSVVFGFFGLVILVPLLKEIFQLSVGESALAGGIILAFISMPTIISLSTDAISSTPKDLKNASLALGANHLQTIVRVTIPHASSGIISASILGIGRAFGETMAVLMVTGNAAVMPTSITEPVRTITATIASELGEAASGGLHYQALFVLGCFLFVFTFVTNLVAEYFAIKR